MERMIRAVERVGVLVEGGWALEAAVARVAEEEGVEYAALLAAYEA